MRHIGPLVLLLALYGLVVQAAAESPNTRKPSLMLRNTAMDYGLKTLRKAATPASQNRKQDQLDQALEVAKYIERAKTRPDFSQVRIIEAPQDDRQAFQLYAGESEIFEEARARKAALSVVLKAKAPPAKGKYLASKGAAPLEQTDPARRLTIPAAKAVKEFASVLKKPAAPAKKLMLGFSAMPVSELAQTQVEQRRVFGATSMTNGVKTGLTAKADARWYQASQPNPELLAKAK